MDSIRRGAERTVLIVLIALMAAACGRERPIYQVENHPIPQRATPLSMDQIGDIIVKAGKATHWRIRKLEPGRLRGLISWRRHSAVVAITHDQRSFSIRYESSRNLLAGVATEEQPFTGKQVIHRKYNQHVRRLENEIDHELAF